MTQRRLWIDKLSAEEVLTAFSDADYWLSRREVAQALGVSKNKTLINLLEQLVADGYLWRQESLTINGAKVIMYRRASHEQ